MPIFFLAMAVIDGFPAAGVFLLFVMLGMRDGLGVARRAKTRENQVIGWTLAAALIGLAIHNVVEVTYTLAFAGKGFWMFTSMTGLLVRRPELLTQASVVTANPARSSSTPSPKRPAEIVPLGAR